MGLIRLLISDPAAFVMLAVLLLYSVIIHELAHGWVALRMGDETAKWLGRLTLNPIRILEPSRGGIGIRLNAASRMLIVASV